MKVFCIGCTTLALAAGGASADIIHPTSYDMPNGETGSFTYWDDTYNGFGSTTTDGAFLIGGLGDLTDGVIAATNWFDVPGQYVGWNTLTPSIYFNFADTVQIDSITLHVDDSNGAGGVSTPGRILLEWASGSLTFDVTDPAGSEPFALTLSNLGIEGNQVIVTMYDGTSQWVFLSEVEFNGVPAPAAGPLMLGGLAMISRRRR